MDWKSCTRFTISVLLGWWCGMFLVIVFQEKFHIMHKGPDSNVIKKQIYFDPDENAYFQFIPYPVVCPPTMKHTSLK